MVPSRTPTPIGGGQSGMPSLFRSNSEVLGGQGGSMPPQGVFPSMSSPRTQFNGIPNVSSLMNHSFENGNTSHGTYNSGNGPRGGIDGEAESNMSSYGAANMPNPSTSGQVNFSDNKLPDQSQHFRHSQQPLQQYSTNQQQFQSIRGGLGVGGSVKLEPQVPSDQHGASQHQGLGSVKLEPQQMQNIQGIGSGSVKMEAQHSGQSLFLQQQQQQQLLNQMSMSRQSSPAGAAAQMNLLQQQRVLHLQQQQLLNSMPQQRSQPLQQFSSHNSPIRSPLKSVYEPGMCARRLTHYMYQQQHRPEDNNIEFWRKFVNEYFAPNAKKKWCVSMYGSGRQTTGVFPQDLWHCEICKRKPGRGFEATVEVLPRLFKIKYESGTLEELLYVDMPREYQNSSGQIVLDYAKAIQESVFEQLRVARDGQLRIVFSPDLKICSWEFCARRHEELIPRRLLIPQVSQLGIVAQKYQAAAQNSSSNMPISELQSSCNMFVASTRQLAKTLEVPLVNDLGYTKRYVRCLQISEVVNSMKDLIDYSRLTGAGPMESLAKFPRRTSTPSVLHGRNQLPQEQQQQHQSQQPLQQAMVQNSNNNDHGSTQARAMQVTSTNGVTSVNNSLNASSSSTSQSTIAGLLHQNSMNSRHQLPTSSANGSYGAANSLQMPSPGSSNNPPQTPHGTMSAPSAVHMNSANSPSMSNMQQPSMSGDGDTNDSQSSVQKFMHEMMMNNQVNGGGFMGMGSLGTDVKTANGVLTPGNFVRNVPNSSFGVGPFDGTGGGMSQSSLVNGYRGTMGNNSRNGRAGGMSSMVREQGMNHHSQQQDLSNQMLNSLGAVNGLNGFQFD